MKIFIYYFWSKLNKYFKHNSVKNIWNSPSNSQTMIRGSCSRAPSEDSVAWTSRCLLTGWSRWSRRRSIANDGGVATISSDENLTWKSSPMSETPFFKDGPTLVPEILEYGNFLVLKIHFVTQETRIRTLFIFNFFYQKRSKSTMQKLYFYWNWL